MLLVAPSGLQTLYTRSPMPRQRGRGVLQVQQQEWDLNRMFRVRLVPDPVRDRPEFQYEDTGVTGKHLVLPTIPRCRSGRVDLGQHYSYKP